MALRPCVPGAPSRRRRRQRNAQHAHVDLGLEHGQRLGREAGRHQHLDELLGDLLRRRAVDRRLKAMMPPKALVGSVWKALA
jgi:hypothetical protein